MKPYKVNIERNPENNKYTMNSTKLSRPMDSVIEDGFIVLFRILDLLFIFFIRGSSSFSLICPFT